MKILLVTEKFSPDNTQRDGGARLVDTLKQGFKNRLSIMQFGGQTNSSATWSFDYPVNVDNRFEKRLANAEFIAQKVKAVEQQFTHIVFIHISMQFGFIDIKLREKIKTWTFPMFLTPSYQASGEDVPFKYTEREFLTLADTQNILTPSYLEKKQLIEFYFVPKQKIQVVPRGVDTSLLIRKIRFFNTVPEFCSVGSIKPQKNILGLIDLFATVKSRFPEAILRVVGPVQNQGYYNAVKNKIEKLGLDNIIEFTGYIPPAKLAFIIENSHIHISTSMCETFGRSIFETLASGIPNIVMVKNNATAEFLLNLPYAKFVNDTSEALDAIEQVFNNLPKLSEMALEIGKLYSDTILGKLLVAKICNKEVIAISDFDGTLFHKNNSEKTKNCVLKFQQFSTKVICSARPLDYLVQEIKHINLKVNWIISYSGAVISDGEGNILFITPINLEDVRRLEAMVPEAKRVIIEDKIVQMSMSVHLVPDIFDLNVEIYQETAFVASWHSSKLRAINKLLNYINWSGKVEAFGDSKYDQEFLTYFDGKLVKINNKA
ncbi:glycosyltransferase [Candidatus Tisiphia endosymbiont of Mystacides longicornis]|uniref:glycosyltransferase n=1 Tax=Candidatus Tisiphia endosymbiont of Mystacides longicornis TaxID=3139330 RepID=UPI003CCB56E7